MIKLQHAKRELNIQNKQNRQQKWIKHIIQSNKKKKKTWTQWQYTWPGGGKGNKIRWPYARTHLKKWRQQRVSQKQERKRNGKLYTLICTLYSMQDGRCPVLNDPLWTASTSVWNRMQVCTHQAGPTKNATFKTGHMDGAATLSRYSLKWEWRQTRLCKHEKRFISDRLHEIFFFFTTRSVSFLYKSRYCM